MRIFVAVGIKDGKEIPIDAPEHIDGVRVGHQSVNGLQDDRGRDPFPRMDSRVDPNGGLGLAMVGRQVHDLHLTTFEGFSDGD